MPARVQSLAGASTGLSGVALLAALTQEDIASWVAFIGAGLATIISWYIARQSELKHAAIRLEAEQHEARRHQERLDAEARREQRLEDLIQAVELRRCALAPGPACDAIGPEFDPKATP